MFSQSSFRPLSQLPPRQPSNPPSPHTSPQVDTHTSPFHENDEFDLSDARFNSRSRTSSTRSLHDGRASPRAVLALKQGVETVHHEHQQTHGGTEIIKPEEITGLLHRLSHSAEIEDKQGASNSSQVHAPVPRHHQTVNKKSAPKQHPTHGSMDRHFSKSLQDEPFGGSGGFGKQNARLSPSPSRHHHQLTALSPLQAFSPLQSTQPLRETSTNSEYRSGHGRSRSNSITKSLSRRQSLIINAERWGKKEEEDEYDARGDAMSLFSRLTLVKAPVEAATLKRAKSSSAITPFANPAKSLDNGPATAARGPRRSFAASSFAGFSPLSTSLKSLPEPFSPHGNDAGNRITHDRHVSDNINTQRKTMSPEEVVDIARSLASPVVIPQGGFNGAELKRRKSAGAVSRRGTTSETVSPEKPPLALEPVEYVLLADDTLLPFVDRPEEVKDLLEHHSNAPMIKLLKAAFPKLPLREHWQALSPDQWYWDEFMRHLTLLSRVECPDYAWIFRARQAVRARSVALWEKLGVCLGCDGDLLNAGGEDGLPPSWGGLGLGDEGEYDPSQNQVWIEGLEAVDPNAKAEVERQFREEFGDIVEDEGEQASAGMTALLGTLGEEEEEEAIGLGIKGRQTTAQREASRNLVDPMDSPSFTSKSLPKSEHSFSPYTPRSPAKSPGKIDAKGRSKSFVGLQILTSPVVQPGVFSKSPISTTPVLSHNALPVFDRGPGSPLFPSSFSSLSAEPNLGRSASIALGGVKPVAYGEQDMQDARSYKRWSGLGRKASGAGLSESAITFASESDYSHSAVGDHD